MSKEKLTERQMQIGLLSKQLEQGRENAKALQEIVKNTARTREVAEQIRSIMVFLILLSLAANVLLAIVRN